MSLPDMWTYTCGTNHGTFLMKEGPKIINGKYPRCPCGKAIMPQALYEACLMRGLSPVEFISMDEMRVGIQRERAQKKVETRKQTKETGRDDEV